MKVESLLKIGTVAALLACVLAPTQARAIGLGPYVSGGGGQLKADYGNANYKFGGIGLALDTAVAEDTLFNYRLQLGYARASYDYSDGNRFEMRHIFGFGVLRTEQVRLWLGPQIGLDYEDFGGGSYVGANIGPALGVNVQFGPVVSLAVTVFGGYGVYTNTSRNNDTSEDHGQEWQAGVNLALLFRFGEGK